jgi:hypothetical protein
MTIPQPFFLAQARWYGCTMYPGYAGSVYQSPILIRAVLPLKSGKGWLRLAFLNAFYAPGAREFDKRFRVLNRSQRLIALEEAADGSERIIIVENLTTEWLRHVWPQPDFSVEMSDLEMQAAVNREFQKMAARDYG